MQGHRGLSAGCLEQSSVFLSGGWEPRASTETFTVAVRLFRSRFVSWEDPVRNGSTFPVFVKSPLWALGVRAPLEEKWGWSLEVEGET